MKNWEKRHLAGLGSVLFSFQLQCRTLEVRDRILLTSHAYLQNTSAFSPVWLNDIRDEP